MTADWFAPARCPDRRRARVRVGRNVYEWGIHVACTLYLYDGATLHVDVGLLSCYLRAEVRLFYSQRLLRRAWDRWQAESLAGEHQGVILHVQEPS